MDAAMQLNAPTINSGTMYAHDPVFDMFHLGQQYAPMINFGYTDSNSIYSDLDFAYYGETDSSVNSTNIFGSNPVDVSGDLVSIETHCDFDVTPITTPYELPDNCTELHIPIFTSFDVSMLGHCNVGSLCSCCGLTCMRVSHPSIG